MRPPNNGELEALCKSLTEEEADQVLNDPRVKPIFERLMRKYANGIK